MITSWAGRIFILNPCARISNKLLTLFSQEHLIEAFIKQKTKSSGFI